MLSINVIHIMILLSEVAMLAVFAFFGLVLITWVSQQLGGPKPVRVILELVKLYFLSEDDLRFADAKEVKPRRVANSSLQKILDDIHAYDNSLRGRVGARPVEKVQEIEPDHEELVLSYHEEKVRREAEALRQQAIASLEEELFFVSQDEEMVLGEIEMANDFMDSHGERFYVVMAQRYYRKMANYPQLDENLRERFVYYYKECANKKLLDYLEYELQGIWDEKRVLEKQLSQLLDPDLKMPTEDVLHACHEVGIAV